MFRWPSSAPECRSTSMGSDSSDDRLSALLAQHIEEYKYGELRKREGKLLAKLHLVKEQLAGAKPRDYNNISPCNSLPRSTQSSSLPRSTQSNSLPRSTLSSFMKMMSSSENSLSATSSEKNLTVTSSTSRLSLNSDRLDPVQQFCGNGVEIDSVEYNEEDASMRERNIIDFETMKQGEDEGLDGWMTRLQHGVVAAYGDEVTETLQRRVAWAFIRGSRDHNVRCWVVANGWNKAPCQTLTPAELLALAMACPVVKCEGTVKRKITKAPPEIKSVEKAWSNFYAVLKSNTIYFFKDIKHFKRNEFESACDLAGNAMVYLEPDKKGTKLLKISKDNGLEMLFRVKTEAGVKSTSLEVWFEQLFESAGMSHDQDIKNSLPTSDASLENSNGYHSEKVCSKSIIDCKEITKKDINEFLNQKIQRSSSNKTSIQKILEEQGIDISHLDKSKKKEVLNKLLSSRPSFGDLQKKGLIKYTVFGCPLSTLCSREKVLVPHVVTQCIEAIEHRGLKSSGIYRISGNSASIQKLRFRVDKEEPVNLKDAEYDINMLTGFFKMFLRELPEPVIPFEQYAQVESAIRNGDSGYMDSINTLQKVVQDLPEPNKSTFKYIILHLVRVANDEENQMDEHNLSIIFGPSLLGNSPERANLLVDLPIQNSAIEKIITNYRLVFK